MHHSGHERKPTLVIARQKRQRVSIVEVYVPLRTFPLLCVDRPMFAPILPHVADSTRVPCPIRELNQHARTDLQAEEEDTVAGGHEKGTAIIRKCTKRAYSGVAT